MNSVGVVVIGRNEGERLKTCIHSLAVSDLKIVYVDSGSTDNSVGFVVSQGFDVVDLDMSIPFSAARARNEGYRFLIDKYSDIDFIQFVDGDCEISQGWIQIAYQHLLDNEKLAAVCGRRRERYPNKTIYNRLCDIEWDTPVGIAMATGGDFMCRKQAIVSVDGFSPQVIAGEEPEMCFRLREKGWKIERLDAEMTMHDANMTSFYQWWKRCERAGHAYAQGFSMHGASDEKYYRVDLCRVLIWALLFPVFILSSVLFFGGYMFFLILFYFLKVAHVFFRDKAVFGGRVAFFYSLFLMLGKFPECKGVVTFFFRSLFGRAYNIIEYK